MLLSNKDSQKLMAIALASCLFLSQLSGTKGAQAAPNARITNWESLIVTPDSVRERVLKGPLASPKFEKAMDLVTDSVTTENNQAQMLLSGIMSYKARYQLLENAQKSIVISTLSIYAHSDSNGEVQDELTRKMVDLLIKAHRRGVKVLVILDGFTSLFAGAHAAIDKLREAGIEVTKYNPVNHDSFDNWITAVPALILRSLFANSVAENRWHEKSMVIDGKYAIIGGLNWGELYGYGNQYTAASYPPSYLYNSELGKEIGLPAFSDWGKTTKIGWRDTDVLLKGPVVQQIQFQLLKDLYLLKHTGNKRVLYPKWEDIDESDYVASEQVMMETYFKDEAFFPKPENIKTENPLRIRYVYHRPYMHDKLRKKNKQKKNFGKELGVYVNSKRPHLNITNYYINTINNAQHQILWGSHSNKAVPDMMKALTKAAQRGVKIYLIGNTKETAASLADKGFFMYSRARCTYYKLLKAGNGNIRIFEWQPNADVIQADGSTKTLSSGAFHSKTFIVDGYLTSVGSYNLAPASFAKHTEGTVVISNPDFARHNEMIYAHDLQFTQEMTLPKAKQLYQQFCSGQVNQQSDESFTQSLSDTQTEEALEDFYDHD